jgi:hypothetical protein
MTHGGGEASATCTTLPRATKTPIPVHISSQLM